MSRRAQWITPFVLIFLPVAIGLLASLLRSLAGCATIEGGALQCRHFGTLVPGLLDMTWILIVSLIGVPIGLIWLWIVIGLAIERKFGAIPNTDIF